MADVISRIVLQAQGGDQVAREVEKVKRAYKETNEEAQKMSSSGGGADSSTSFDAFDRATSSSAGTDQTSRRMANEEYDRRVQQRMSQHAQVAQGGVGGTFNGRGVQQAIGAASTAASGDVAGGAASGLGLLAGAGPLGIAAMAASAGIIGAQKLSEKESERRSQLGFGLMQRLGAPNWETFRGQIIELENQGVAREHLMPYLNTLSSSGGTFDQGSAQLAGRLALSKGVQPGSLAGWQAALQKAGMGNLSEEGLGAEVMRGEQAFGRAGLSQMFSTLSQSLEQSMSRGFERGSERISENFYQNGVRLLTSFSSAGGMSIDGATRLYNHLQQTRVQRQNLSRPEDVFAYMAMREEGDSHYDTLRNLSARDSDLQLYTRLREMAGSREELEGLSRRFFNLDVEQIDPFIDGMETQYNYSTGNFTPLDTGGGSLRSIYSPDDEILRGIVAEQSSRNMVERGQRRTRNILDWIRVAITGGEPLNPLVHDEAEILSGGYAGLESRGMEMTMAAQQGQSWRLLRALPESIRGRAEEIIDNDTGWRGVQSGFTTEMLRQIAQYEAFKNDPSSFTDNQQLMFEQNAPAFEKVIELMENENLDRLSTRSGLQAFESNLSEIEKKNLDNLPELTTIVDLLYALMATLGIEYNTDEGSTE